MTCLAVRSKTTEFSPTTNAKKPHGAPCGYGENALAAVSRRRELPRGGKTRQQYPA